jgi:signal transduction histidine kinase
MFNKGLLVSEKRNLLINRIALYCAGFSLLHLVIDASHGLYQSVIFDCGIVLIIAGCYLLNHYKFHRSSKIIALVSMNLAFLIYASVVPKAVGIYLFYFPLVAISSAFFENNEKMLRYFFIGLPFLLLLVLFFSDFKILGDVRLQGSYDVNVKAFFVTNAISSAIIMVVCIDFMLKLNESSERELHDLAEEVKAKNHDLIKTNAELDRFLYSTSHDLRSPLSSIKGLINVARYDTHDEKINRYFNMMIDRVDKLDLFIKDIIDYSKNARTELRNEPVDFSTLLNDVTENLQFLEGADRIEIKKEITIPFSVMIDRNRLSVILNNLIANAIKYHDPRKENQWIKVGVGYSNENIEVSVADNGTGISPEHQAKVFEMFYRGTLLSSGSGLGLYIVKETVAKMEGTIGMESRPGVGSNFLITIPLCEDCTAQMIEHQAQSQPVLMNN